MRFKNIPRTVFVLGLVSFFNDLASEMIYPIVPLFLTTVLHTSLPLVGLIEGIAEATASITKYLFGAYADYLQKRKPFVVIGYGFGAISKLLIGAALGWPLVLFARFTDRLGKGIRTAPRDSLLLENSTPKNKGYIFGFHRSFDSLGAVVGPLVALLLLSLLHENIRLTFYIAFIPGVIAVILIMLLVKEKPKPRVLKPQSFPKISWRLLSPRLRLFLFISLLFALGNSADTFLLLRAKQLGLTTTLVVLAYVLYNISQTIFSTPLGLLSDKFGAKKVFSAGLIVFAVVYFFFGVINQTLWIWLLFPVYGLYIAATDGIAKAYISEFITKEESGTFFGAYYAITAVGTLVASVVGGILWVKFAPSATFFYGSFMAFMAFWVFIFFTLRFQKNQPSHSVAI